MHSHNFSILGEILNYCEQGTIKRVAILSKRHHKAAQSSLVHIFIDENDFGLRDSKYCYKYHLKKINIDKFKIIDERIHHYTHPSHISFETKILEKLLHSINLKHLSLSNRCIRTIPENIGNFVGLETVCFYNNSLSSIPESITQLKYLKILVLSNNNFSSIPEYIGQLESLENLYIPNNHLTEMPNSIRKLSKLRYIHLENNRLTSFPKGLEHLDKLVELNLRNNELVILPPSICQLKRLEILDLGFNKFISIPNEIKYLERLEMLDLSFNRFISIPNEIKYFKRLKMLSFINKTIDSKRITDFMQREMGLKLHDCIDMLHDTMYRTRLIFSNGLKIFCKKEMSLKLNNFNILQYPINISQNSTNNVQSSINNTRGFIDSPQSSSASLRDYADNLFCAVCEGVFNICQWVKNIL